MELYRAAWIIPACAPAIRDGMLAVENGRIAWLGAAKEAPAGRTHDLGHAAILPGFVNAHTHLELTSLKGQITPRPLWAWFEALLRRIRSPGFDPEESVRDGVRESLHAGVTCIGDVSRTGLQIAAMKDSPIRSVCFVELISGAAQPPHDIPSLQRTLDASLQHEAAYQRRTGVSPHTPYTVRHEDMRAAIRLARETGRPLTTHFLETQEEADWLHGRASPLTEWLQRFNLPAGHDAAPEGAAAYLESVEMFSIRPLLVHLNYADDAMIAGIAAASASVAFCPRAHAYFGHRDHRWQAMLRSGVNVCLGTDSAASNDSLSILDEMRFLHRAAPEAPVETLLQMGTINGARALGWGQEIGDLSAGRFADFCAISPSPSASDSPLAQILEGDSSIAGTWIAGQRVV